MRSEYGDLPLEAKNRAIDIRLARQNGQIVAEIAGLEIVGPINDEIVILADFFGIGGSKPLLEGSDLDFWVDLLKPFARALDLLSANILGAMEELPLQVRKVDMIEVDNAEFSDSGGDEIHGHR